jgi:hypothetical protein
MKGPIEAGLTSTMTKRGQTPSSGSKVVLQKFNSKTSNSIIDPMMKGKSFQSGVSSEANDYMMSSS